MLRLLGAKYLHTRDIDEKVKTHQPDAIPGELSLYWRPMRADSATIWARKSGGDSTSTSAPHCRIQRRISLGAETRKVTMHELSDCGVSRWLGCHHPSCIRTAASPEKRSSTSWGSSPVQTTPHASENSRLGLKDAGRSKRSEVSVTNSIRSRRNVRISPRVSSK